MSANAKFEFFRPLAGPFAGPPERTKQAAHRPAIRRVLEEAQPADRNTGGGKKSFRILLETSASCGAHLKFDLTRSAFPH